ncbi:hypothetical protein [Agromyces kandeliae]|uniref:DUF3558 domain-containing protein n=1 Tax=Agromyces kandeliae TaxID=2666141 RepID=A0A6L5R2G0_9MICO|nr:hypothetical protein [Agromyces kandeliae]MRX43638.1 hypothetical protein [Agromyces kandeliae]
MTRLVHPRIVAPVLAALLAIGVAGCTAATTPSSSEPNPSTSAPDDSASADPAPDATTIGATCETLLAPDAYVELEAGGLEARAPTLFDPIAAEIADEGGLVCSWGRPNTDNVVDVAQLAIGDDESRWMSALAEAGYEQDDDPVPGGYRGRPDAANGISPVVVIETGTLTYVSTPTYAAFLRPAS